MVIFQVYLQDMGATTFFEAHDDPEYKSGQISPF